MSLQRFERTGPWYFINDKGQNHIGDEGCEYLAKGRWNKLDKLWLCKLCLSKKITISHIEDARF